MWHFFYDLDIIKSEILDFPLDGLTVVLANGDLHVPSKDHVFEWVLNYVLKNYLSMEEHQNSEVLDFPLDGFTVVLTNDDLLLPSEDPVFEGVRKKKYPSMEERQNVRETRRICLIRFCYMSCGKIKDVLTCPKFEIKSTNKLVIEALFFKVEMMHSLVAATLNARGTTCAPGLE
ncbi:hypothetical protein QQ045_018851 [Rhodiola kirilowii]